MRLTLMYGALFVVSGAVLLAVTYLLISNSPVSHFNIIETRGPGPQGAQPGNERPLDQLPDLGRSLEEDVVRQHDAELHDLLVRAGIALVIMALISIVVGWLAAGRILRPLRTMTAAIQQISATNVHERLAAKGPRDEMTDLSDTVDGLLGRLETALDAQKRFVANAAHELRTPLTLQHALIEEILIDRDVSLPAFQSTFERLLVLGKGQGRLLESLLTLASSERGLDRREPVDLATLAEQVLLLFQPELQRRGLRLEADLRPARVSGDPALVERLVANLVDNAIGYNTPGGWVQVSTASAGGQAVLFVVNTGSAVPSEQVDRLFEPFQRLDRTAGRDAHHGLGLSIVSAIASAHEAAVVAHARPDGGLEIGITFPVPSSEHAAAAVGVLPLGDGGLGGANHLTTNDYAMFRPRSDMS